MVAPAVLKLTLLGKKEDLYGLLSQGGTIYYVGRLSKQGGNLIGSGSGGQEYNTFKRKINKIVSCS